MTWRGATLALVLMLGSAPLGAARPASLAGSYALEGALEVMSELLMTPDGGFQWYLTRGENDLFADGSWNATKTEVILSAKLDGQDAPPPGFETMRLQLRNGRLIPPDGKGSYVKKAK